MGLEAMVFKAKILVVRCALCCVAVVGGEATT